MLLEVACCILDQSACNPCRKIDLSAAAYGDLNGLRALQPSHSGVVLACRKSCDGSPFIARSGCPPCFLSHRAAQNQSGPHSHVVCGTKWTECSGALLFPSFPMLLGLLISAINFFEYKPTWHGESLSALILQRRPDHHHVSHIISASTRPLQGLLFLLSNSNLAVWTPNTRQERKRLPSKLRTSDKPCVSGFQITLAGRIERGSEQCLDECRSTGCLTRMKSRNFLRRQVLKVKKFDGLKVKTVKASIQIPVQTFQEQE